MKGSFVATTNSKNELGHGSLAVICLDLEGLPSGQYDQRAIIKTLGADQSIGWQIAWRSTKFIVEYDSRGSLHPRKHVFEVLVNSAVVNKLSTQALSSTPLALGPRPSALGPAPWTLRSAH